MQNAWNVGAIRMESSFQGAIEMRIKFLDLIHFEKAPAIILILPLPKKV